MHIVIAKRTFHLFGDINDENMRNFLAWYREHATEDSTSWLSLCITSGGGSITGGFGAIDFALSIQKMQLQTVALGAVSSMAIPLFLTGQHRVVSPRTTFLIHEMGTTFNKDCRYSTSEFRKGLHTLELREKMYSEFVESRTEGKFSATDCLKMMREEVLLEAPDVLRLGLAHEISSES